MFSRNNGSCGESGEHQASKGEAAKGEGAMAYEDAAAGVCSWRAARRLRAED